MKMCAAPTSAAEAPPAARAAGWTAADVRWEQLALRGALLHGGGRGTAAAHCWRQALRLARRHFHAPDPRLACAFANAARAAPPADAETLRQQARELWRQVPLWIDQAVLTPRARSSLHHFRLEQRHRGVYASRERHALHEAAATARAQLDGDGKRAAAQQLAQWRREKPPLYCDSRKLLAACLLQAGDD